MCMCMNGYCVYVCLRVCTCVYLGVYERIVCTCVSVYVYVCLRISGYVCECLRVSVRAFT